MPFAELLGKAAPPGRQTKKPKDPRRVRLEPDQTLSPLLRTASLGLGVLREAGLRSWGDLGPDCEHWPAHVVLSDEQLNEMRHYSWVLAWIAWGKRGETRTVYVAACSECGLVETTHGSPSARCRLHLGCGGKPIKAPAAKSVVIEEPT